MADQTTTEAPTDLSALRTAAEGLMAALELQNGTTGFIPQVLTARRNLAAALEGGPADPAPAERPAPVGSWWSAPGGQILQVDGDYLDGPGDQIVTYTEYSPDGTTVHGKWGGAEFAAAYTRIDADEVPDWVEVAW